MGQVKVYRYGSDPRTPPPPEVMAQVRLAHELRNRLVEITLYHDKARDDALGEHSQVADLEVQLGAAQVVLGNLIETAKRERMQDRRSRPRSETASNLKLSRAEVKELRARLKAARREAAAKSKPRLAVIDAAYRSAVKDTYREYVDKGLYWATHGLVVRHHDVARRRVITDRAAGKPAQMRFHRWDGTGTIAVQLQRQQDKPPRTPQLLASGKGPWREVLQLAPWQEDQRGVSRAQRRKMARTGVARLRVGAQPQHVQVPVVVHRMMPADADVADAQLTITREAGRHRTALSLTAKLPDPPVNTDRPVVLVRPRWASQDGSLVAAEWQASAPLSVPEGLASVVLTEDGLTGSIVVPGSVEGRVHAAEELRGVRDRTLDAMRPQLVAALRKAEEAGTAGADDPKAADVARWRSPARFAALALRWREEGRTTQIALQLERWRKLDRKRWEAETHMRRRALAHRKDTWRRAAAWLAESSSRVDAVKVEVAKLTRRAPIGEPVTTPTEQSERARRQRQLTAPAELVGAIRAACAARGVASGDVLPVSLGTARAPISAAHE